MRDCTVLEGSSDLLRLHSVEVQKCIRFFLFASMISITIGTFSKNVGDQSLDICPTEPGHLFQDCPMGRMGGIRDAFETHEQVSRKSDCLVFRHVGPPQLASLNVLENGRRRVRVASPEQKYRDIVCWSNIQFNQSDEVAISEGELGLTRGDSRLNGVLNVELP